MPADMRSRSSSRSITRVGRHCSRFLSLLVASLGPYLATASATPHEHSPTITPLVGTFLGDHQRNFYGNRAPKQLRVRWKTHLGSGQTFFRSRLNWMSGAGWTGQPLLMREGRRLILIQGSYDHHLRKLDADTGTVLWKSRLGDAVKSTPTYYDCGQGPAEQRHVLITGTRHGLGINLRKDPAYALRGISLLTGRELWRHDVVLTDSNSRDCDASAAIYGNRAGIPLENGRFTVFSPDPANAFRGEHGFQPTVFHVSALYRKSDRDTYGYDLAAESSPTLLGPSACIAAGCGRVYAKSMLTGKTTWSIDIGGDLNGSMPLTQDGCLLLAIEQQYLKGPGGLMKLRPHANKRGSVVWFLPWPSHHFCDWEGGIIGSPTINARYGASSPGQGNLCCAVGVDGTMRIIDHTRTVSAATPSPMGDRLCPMPKVIDEVKLPAGSISTPIFVRDRILIGHDTGLCLFKVSPEGKLSLLDSLPGPMFDATPVVWDGRVYIASRDGFLYCLE